MIKKREILFRKEYQILLLTVFFLFLNGESIFIKAANLTILHTNDIHSHLSQFPLLSTKVEEIREEKRLHNEPVLLLDSGDFMMGTLYSCIATRESAELNLMKVLGYDATTLGNHEFDFSPSFLAKVISVAREKKGSIPIISSNILFDPLFSGDNELRKLYKRGMIRPYLIKILSNGIKVGIIGLLGKNAEITAVNKFPVRFNHNEDFLQRLVDEVKSKGIDLLICLSHSGVDEDKKLAEKIEGIDIIIAGHDHLSLCSPLWIKDTLIVEAGCYLKYLGKLEISVNKGKVLIRDYRLIPLNENIKRDKFIQKAVDQYSKIINVEILKPLGLSFSSPLAKTSFNLTGRGFLRDNELGNLVTDAIKEVVSSYQSERPVDFVFLPNALIREGITEGEITPADVFRVLPLGLGLDGKCGYPLVSFYLNTRQIKQILEVSIFFSQILGNKAFFQISGLRFKYDILRPLFNKVVKIEKWNPEDKSYTPLSLQENTLYKVVTDFLTMNLFSLFITLRDFKGNPLNIFGEGRKKVLIDINSSLEGIQELKGWKALVDYLQILPDLNNDSLPDIPLKYAVSQRRVEAPPENILRYGMKRKEPGIAVGGALIFPSLGHIYCEREERGIKFFLLEVGSLFLMREESTRNLGIFSFTVFKIWECIDAYYTAEEYNKKLAQEFHLNFLEVKL